MGPAKVIIVSSVMFAFISYWRTAAIVLCDLASTSYYIGGIVEQAIGPAAPWFILAVMIFSYGVRSVYIESCSLFVRGGVYRIVKEAMGGFLAKLSVSALMFDYILTGPTSGVSAGQYVMGFSLLLLKLYLPGFKDHISDEQEKSVRRIGSVVIACAVTLYFFRQNILGIHESSGKALKIMIATTVMAVIMLTWCVVSVGVHLHNGDSINAIPLTPNLEKKVELETAKEKDPYGQETEVYVRDFIDPETGKPRLLWNNGKEGAERIEINTNGFKPKLDEDGLPIPKENQALKKLGTSKQDSPLGWLADIHGLDRPQSWLSLIGLIGLFIAFGHSVLAMSGEETLAQVYREVESPKMKNFKKAAFIVFVYSIVLTAGISFLAVMLIPDEVRMKDYSDNLIGGLARYVWSPWPLLNIALEGFVVVIGFLILSGAVNTAIIGSNGVLNRVAEDGVLPDALLKPHPRFGTTYRVLYLIVGLQIGVIVFSGGDMVVLGEAYAFGVVWSFVFQVLAMVVLRFKDKSPREYKVPFNFHVGKTEIPVGLLLIFMVLFFTAVLNFMTKEVATIGGISITAFFLIVFAISEHYHEKKLKGRKHSHMEQFNKSMTSEVTPESLGLTKGYRKLVSIRSTQNLFMLERALDETDPTTTGIVVMTAKVLAAGQSQEERAELDAYDLQLMTAVVQRAEKAGKQVRPLIVPTNNPLHAILNTAKDLQAHELIMGASNKYTADEQLEQIAFYWISLHDGTPPPLTVRILNAERDISLDLAGGNRIPKISEARARTVAELRAAGVGVDRVLLAHDGTQASSDLFNAVLTMLDAKVDLALVPVPEAGEEAVNGQGVLNLDEERARQLGRTLTIIRLDIPDGPGIVAKAREGLYDLIILPMSPELPSDSTKGLDERTRYILRHAHSRVMLAAAQTIPQEIVDLRPG